MKRLAEFLSLQARPGPDRWTAYLAADPAAATLLRHPPPRALIPLATLRDWIAAETGLPAWLIEASRKASGDLAEALALMLPPAIPPEPDLAEVLGDLATLPPGPLSRVAILSMARRLPPEARVIYFRLVTGTFRPPVPAPLPAPTTVKVPRTVLAVMIYAEAALATGARGPEVTLAVWSGADLIPIARAPANLPPTETAALMAWIRENATGRFGPLRAVPARQVFRLDFSGLTANQRRKSGLTLTDPQIVEWLPDADPATASHLAALTALLPNSA